MRRWKASGSCTRPCTFALYEASTRWPPVAQVTGQGGIAYSPEASYRGLACAKAVRATAATNEGKSRAAPVASPR